MTDFGPAADPGRGRVVEWDRLPGSGGYGIVHVDHGPLGGLVAEGVDTVDTPGGIWSVHYRVETAADHTPRRVAVRSVSAAGVSARTIEHDGSGRWRLDGGAARHLDDCRDVVLASTVLTSSLVVRRLDLAPGDVREVTVVWVGAPDLQVEAAPQVYRRAPDEDGHAVYALRSGLAVAERRFTVDGDGVTLDVAHVATRRRADGGAGEEGAAHDERSP